MKKMLLLLLVGFAFALAFGGLKAKIVLWQIGEAKMGVSTCESSISSPDITIPRRRA